MNYGQIISKAWKSMWKDKILWVFGVLAGQLTIRNLVITLISPNQPMAASTDDLIRQYLYTLNAEDTLLYVFIGFLAILGIARIFVMMIGSIGVTRGVVAVRTGKKLDLAGLFQETPHFFWRILGFLLISTFLIGMVFGPLFLFLDFYRNAPESILVFFFGICGLFLFMLVPLWLIGFGTSIMLINDWSIRDSIAEAWNFVIRKHLGQFIVLGLVVGLVGAGISLLFSIPNFLISIFTMNDAFLRTPVEAALTGDTLTRLLSLIIQLYSAWWQALLVVFSTTAFVHAYLDMKEADAEPSPELPTEGDEYLTASVVEANLFAPSDDLPSSE